MRQLAFIGTLAVFIFALSPAIAQDDDAPETVALWLASEEEEDTAPRYVAFLFLDDDRIIEVGFGADVIYTLEADGSYSGVPLVPSGFDFSATLTLIDGETIQVASETTSGIFSTESDITYTLTDREAGIWIENPREVIDFSKFGECIGREPISPPGGFADADPILPLIIDEDAGELWRGPEILTGAGGTFEIEIDGEFSQYTDKTTMTAVLNEDNIDFTYYSIAGERDDCVMHYVSSYTRFDGDMADVFERIDEMTESDDH